MPHCLHDGPEQHFAGCKPLLQWESGFGAGGRLPHQRRACVGLWSQRCSACCHPEPAPPPGMQCITPHAGLPDKLTSGAMLLGLELVCCCHRELAGATEQLKRLFSSASLMPLACCLHAAGLLYAAGIQTVVHQQKHRLIVQTDQGAARCLARHMQVYDPADAVFERRREAQRQQAAKEEAAELARAAAAAQADDEATDVTTPSEVLRTAAEVLDGPAQAVLQVCGRVMLPCKDLLKRCCSCVSCMRAWSGQCEGPLC